MSRLLLSLSLLLILVTSCSKRGELLDTVPANSLMMVATADAKHILNDVGVKFTSDGGLEVTTSIDSRIGADLRQFLTVMARLDKAGVVDLGNIVIAADDKAFSYFTFCIDGFSKFKDITDEVIEWGKDSEGFHVGSLHSELFSIVCSDTQGWIVNRDVDAAKMIKNTLAEAKKMSVGSVESVRQALRSADNLITIATPSNMMVTLIGGKLPETEEIPIEKRDWNIATIRSGADKSLDVEWSCMSSEGATVKPKGMKNVNPALLAYVPADYCITFAAGITEGFDWKPVEKLALMLGGFQGAAFMSVVSPYLQSIDGTVLLAAKPVTPEAFGYPDPSDWDFILLVRMPQEKINSLLSMIRTMAFTGGISPAVDPVTGIMALPQYGRTLYIGNVDGNLGIATAPFDNTRNNSLAPVFVNKDMAMNITLTPLSAYLPETPAGIGVEVDASMDNGKGQAKFTIHGSDKSVLEYIFSMYND